MQEDLLEVVKAFEKDEESAEDELVVDLECFVFDGKYTNKLNKLTEKRVVKEEGRERTVSNHKACLGFFHNFLSNDFPVCSRAWSVLMSMPVTVCASERNWSKWGLTYVPNRNALGVASAQKVIYLIY
jgi:hypothetical protein